MAQKKNLTPDRVYRLWESTRDIIDFAAWLPEVVGTKGELMRIGLTLVARMSDEEPIVIDVQVTEPLRFIDSDVSKYRKALDFFRKKHHIKP